MAGWYDLTLLHQQLSISLEKNVAQKLRTTPLISVKIDDPGLGKPERPSEEGSTLVEFFKPPRDDQGDLLQEVLTLGEGIYRTCYVGTDRLLRLQPMPGHSFATLGFRFFAHGGYAEATASLLAKKSFFRNFRGLKTIEKLFLEGLIDE